MTITTMRSSSIIVAELSGEQRMKLYNFVQDHFKSKVQVTTVSPHRQNWEIAYCIGNFSSTFEVSETFLQRLLQS